MKTQRDLSLYYEGTDITGDVDIIECTHTDACGGEHDCLNILLDHAETWFKWGPQRGDRIRAVRAGYDTEDLFLNAVRPENGAYRIYARAAHTFARQARSRSYENCTLAQVLSHAAAEEGMYARVFGINGGIRYAYLLRDELTGAQFLSLLAAREGAEVKSLCGAYSVIGVEYAQSLPARHEMELADDQPDCRYTDTRGESLSAVIVRQPEFEVRVSDTACAGRALTLTNLFCADAAQAYRWAKGILLSLNRRRERVDMEMDFNPGLSAMVRVDIASRGPAAGNWLVDRCEHNLLDGRTKATMYRCVDSIG